MTVSAVQGKTWWAQSPQLAAGLHPLGAVSLCRSREHTWFTNSGCHTLLFFLPALQSVLTTTFSRTWGIKWNTWCVLCRAVRQSMVWWWHCGKLPSSGRHRDEHHWRCAVVFNKAKLPRTIPSISRWLQTQVPNQMPSHHQHFCSLRCVWQSYQALKLLDHDGQKESSPRSLAPKWVSFQGILHSSQTQTVKCNPSAPRLFLGSSLLYLCRWMRV